MLPSSFTSFSRATALVGLLLLLVAPPASAQDDAYHADLRSRLEADHGITGGTWVLPATETATLAALQATGVTAVQFTVSDQPFTRAVRVSVGQVGPNPWDRTIRFPNQAAIREGDVLLLVVWLRGTTSTPGARAFVQPIFEQASDPYTKSLTESFEIGDTWEQVLLPFAAKGTYAAGQARLQFNMGDRLQRIDIGGVALLNFGTTRTVASLPRVRPKITYVGQDPNAPWRAAAAQRIEQHRKAPLAVTVVDPQGRPIPGATVAVKMKRHTFGFGTAVTLSRMSGNTADNVRYREKLSNLAGDGRSFNISVLENEMKWPSWEEPWWSGGQAQVVNIVRWLREHGMEVRGHNLVWPGEQWLPADIVAAKDNPTYINNRIARRIDEGAGYPGIKGVIKEWDVINEPVHNPFLANVFRDKGGYADGEAVYTEWLQWAREADPDAGLFINEYEIISRFGPFTQARSGFKALLRKLIDAGAPVTGIGIQGHMGDPLTPPDTVLKVLDEFAAFGLDLAITEYDASGIDEAVAGDYLRDLLTVAFSHPAMKSFLMWGFWDGAHWHQDAPLFRADWSIKPAGQAFLDLVFDAWWTDEQGATTETGRYETRGFLGDYEIAVTVDGKTLRQPAVLPTGGADLQITFDATALPTDEVPPAGDTLDLGAAYPNPFHDTATLEYSLPRAAEARLAVYDLLGRRVAVLVDGRQAAGSHRARFDAAGLPAGSYLARLDAGGASRTARLVLLP